MNVNEDKLNPTEKDIHKMLIPAVKEKPTLKILEAATLCEVSSSKISKYVKKLGFENFKQYKLHFSGQNFYQKKEIYSSEIERIKNFLENFNKDLVVKFLEKFNNYDKIILFGLGPSYICIEYFAYKLNFISDKKIFFTQEEDSIHRLTDLDTLVIIFSVTGCFSNFDNLARNVKAQGGSLMLILEEYNNNIPKDINNIFYLTTSTQDQNLLPYEKTRTAFFIFIEEIVYQLMNTP